MVSIVNSYFNSISILPTAFFISTSPVITAPADNVLVAAAGIKTVNVIADVLLTTLAENLDAERV